MTSVVAAAGQPFGNILGLEYLLGPAVVGGLAPFGLLGGAVILSRSSLPWGRSAATFLSIVFLSATGLGILAIGVAGPVSVLIGVVSAALVGACGLALVVASALPTEHPRVVRLARWGPVIVAISLLLGAAGFIGFWILDLPVHQIAVYQGIGSGDANAFELWYRSRNQVPIALSILAAGMGAIAWRANGRVLAATSTMVGCIAIGVNVVQLILQNAE